IAQRRETGSNTRSRTTPKSCPGQTDVGSGYVWRVLPDKKRTRGQLRTGPPQARLIDYAAVGPPFRAKDLEHEARTRDAAKNHPRMDGASEGQATDRGAGQALR